MTAQPTIIIVDDDPGIRESLEGLLRSIGLQVKSMASLPEFVTGGRPEGPACLVLDVRLPGRSGLDFQRELAEANIRIPIIFITGYGDIPMSVQAIKGGAIEFLTKPFRDQDLLDAIQLGLERDRVWLENEKAIAELRGCFDTLTAPIDRHIGPTCLHGGIPRRGPSPVATVGLLRSGTKPRYNRDDSLARCMHPQVQWHGLKALGSVRPSFCWRDLNMGKATLAKTMAWKAAALVSGIGLGMLSYPVHAAPSSGGDTVKGLYDALLSTMKNGRILGQSGRFAQLDPVIRRSFDIASMARLSIGSSWAGLNENQRQQITDSFGRYISAIYADRFDSYAGQKL